MHKKSTQVLWKSEAIHRESPTTSPHMPGRGLAEGRGVGACGEWWVAHSVLLKSCDGFGWIKALRELFCSQGRSCLPGQLLEISVVRILTFLIKFDMLRVLAHTGPFNSITPDLKNIEKINVSTK